MSNTQKRQKTLRWVSGLLLLAMTVLAAPVAAANARVNCSGIHIVHRGESLSLIAAKRGVSLATLLACNRLRHPSRIYAGQRIRVPAAKPITPTPPPEVHEQYPQIRLEAYARIPKTIGMDLRRAPQVQPRMIISQVQAAQTPGEWIDLIGGLTENPVLLLAKQTSTNSRAITLTLYTAGRTDILSALAVSGTVTVATQCGDGVPAESYLGNVSESLPTSVTVRLQEDEQNSFGLATVGYVLAVDKPENLGCKLVSENEIVLMVIPLGQTGAYRLLLNEPAFAGDLGDGIPGRLKQILCKHFGIYCG